MNKITILLLLLLLASIGLKAQTSFSKHELSINGFRNPSIGLEYRYKQTSVHAGYYITNFEKGITTKFTKAGFNYWFLPVGKGPNSSSFFAGLSIARGQNLKYEDQNAGIAEVGFRWVIYKGLNVRIGLAALAAEGEPLKVNPTPGISYSFFFN